MIEVTPSPDAGVEARQRLRTTARALEAAKHRRAAAYAARDRAIRGARAGGYPLVAIAETARLSRPGVRVILLAEAGDAPPVDLDAVAAATAEAERVERVYARCRWDRDNALLALVISGTTALDEVAGIAKITSRMVRKIVQAGPTEAPRTSLRPGRPRITDHDADRARRREYTARRRAEVASGARVVTRHDRVGYDEGCHCPVCRQDRARYDRERRAR